MFVNMVVGLYVKKDTATEGEHSAAASCVDNLLVTSLYRSQLYFEGRFSYQCM